VGLKGSYSLRNETGGADHTNFRLWDVVVFSRYVLPNRLTIDSSLGITGLTSSGQSVGPNFASTTNISYQLARTVVTVSFDSGFSETFSEGQNFGVVETQSVTGSVAYIFTPSLTGRVSGSYRRNEPTGFGNSTQSEDTKTWQGLAGLSWRIQRRLNLDLTYSYVNQAGGEGSLDGNTVGNYTENRVQAAFRVIY
jgi:hypothetical protein